MEITYFSDVQKYYNTVEPFLLSHEAENNLIFGILNALREDIHTYSSQHLPKLITVSENQKIHLVSIRTPPYNQVISFTENLDTLAFLADALIETEPKLPGIFGFKEGSYEFVKLWQDRQTVEYSLEMHERFHRLTNVNPDTLGMNTFDQATYENYNLVSRWNDEFLREALPNSSPGEIMNNRMRLNRLLQQRSIYLLRKKDIFVSMARKAGKTPNGQTISGVYTPPAERRKGYGTEVVAKLSQLALDEGNKYCYLATDLANPISNRIYYKIGYRPVIDVDVWRFHYF